MNQEYLKPGMLFQTVSNRWNRAWQCMLELGQGPGLYCIRLTLAALWHKIWEVRGRAGDIQSSGQWLPASQHRSIDYVITGMATPASVS